MSLYKQFATDANIERSGLLLQYGPNSKGKPIGILIARAGGSNTEYHKAFESRTKPHRRLIQIGKLDAEIQRDLMLEVFLDAVIKGWENVEDEKGKPLEFSRAAAKKLFTDLPDLLNDITEQAHNASLFRKAELEAEVKN